MSDGSSLVLTCSGVRQGRHERGVISFSFFPTFPLSDSLVFRIRSAKISPRLLPPRNESKRKVSSHRIK